MAYHLGEPIRQRGVLAPLDRLERHYVEARREMANQCGCIQRGGGEPSNDAARPDPRSPAGLFVVGSILVMLLARSLIRFDGGQPRAH